jgi:hypothetical protein
MEHPSDAPPDRPRKAIRKIRTARSLRSINSAVLQGFLPLLRQVVPSGEISHRYCLMRNTRTGAVVDHVDPRDTMYDSPSWEVVLEDRYYPYYFKSPFAAYLIPKDMEPGEEVLLLDLIEDYVGLVDPGGNTHRLASCRAVWNGSDLEIRYDPDQDMAHAVG